MRSEVREAVGSDFLGTLSDLWRPLGYTGSSFFSWHKMGRAFDTQMEFRGPGGRRDMVLVREEVRGRTMWRMHLRAAAQDGSVGRPLTEPGWTFAAGSGDPDLAAAGGRRGNHVPEGYWLDFTAVAARYGWNRIPSLARSGQDWRRNWSAIDYWHYERRDRLSWFAAAREVYPDDVLRAELRAERLRESGVSFGRLSRLGFPSDWLSGS
jgi:TolB protein